MNTKEKVEENNTELISKKDVKDSPFTIVSMNETEEHFAVLGEYRITEKYKSIEKAEKEVVKITWNRIIQIMMIMTEKMKDNAMIEKLRKN